MLCREEVFGEDSWQPQVGPDLKTTSGLVVWATEPSWLVLRRQHHPSWPCRGRVLGTRVWSPGQQSPWPLEGACPWLSSGG